jgi:hypothetical protein
VFTGYLTQEAVCLAKTDESRWPERQGQYLQMSSYKQYRDMFAITAWRSCGDKKRLGLGVEADDGCCSGYLWY